MRSVTAQDMEAEMKKVTVSAVLMIVLAFCMLSCDNNNAPNLSVTANETVNVIFKINTDPYDNGNVGEYRLQYKAIPLFGGQDTPGRKVNWTDVEHDHGKFVLSGLQKGEWTFYIQIITEKEKLLETQTGTKQLTKDLLIVIDEEPELTGYGYVGIYARAEFVDSDQSIKVTYENTETGTVYELIDAEWTVVRTGNSYIDYSVNTEYIPAGNYMFTVEIYDQLGIKIMSREEPVIVRSTGTDPLIIKLRAESYPGGGFEIDDKSHYLEGVVSGPTEGDINQTYKFTYYPLNKYTDENAVWYWFFADGKRYSSREPYLEVAFPEGGFYTISCSPIGINGEVQRNGAALCYIRIAPPSDTNSVPESPEGDNGEENKIQEGFF